uniref:Uncharacterized protein n=1 Tax=Klebsiella pneumoniae TaxID=573 RepID=A0A8B0SS76_KLEPN|nr:hypothetical protein [Klebsiella pneumoniae]
MPGSCFIGRTDCTVPPQASTACPAAKNITSAVYISIRFVSTRHADKCGLRLTVFPSRYDHSRRISGWCRPDLLPAPHRRAIAAYIRAGGAFRTSPDPVSPG